MQIKAGSAAARNFKGKFVFAVTMEDGFRVRRVTGHKLHETRHSARKEAEAKMANAEWVEEFMRLCAD